MLTEMYDATLFQRVYSTDTVRRLQESSDEWIEYPQGLEERGSPRDFEMMHEWATALKKGWIGGLNLPPGQVAMLKHWNFTAKAPLVMPKKEIDAIVLKERNAQLRVNRRMRSLSAKHSRVRRKLGWVADAGSNSFSGCGDVTFGNGDGNAKTQTC